MTEQDPLTDRLRDLGRQPVDPATSSRHLTAMAAAEGGRRRVSTKLKVGLAFAAGLLIGGTGLASAGALPAPAQNVAHSTLSKVGVDVPRGTERYNDPAVCGLDPATGKPFRNHGQYVKANKANPAAGESRCGKPVKAGTGAEATPGQKPEGTPGDPAQDKGNGQGNNGNGKGNGGSNGSGKPGNAKDKGKEADKPAKPDEKSAVGPADAGKGPVAPAQPTTTAPPPPVSTTVTTMAPTTTTSAAAPPTSTP